MKNKFFSITSKGYAKISTKYAYDGNGKIMLNVFESRCFFKSMDRLGPKNIAKSRNKRREYSIDCQTSLNMASDGIVQRCPLTAVAALKCVYSRFCNLS